MRCLGYFSVFIILHVLPFGLLLCLNVGVGINHENIEGYYDNNHRHDTRFWLGCSIRLLRRHTFGNVRDEKNDYRCNYWVCGNSSGVSTTACSNGYLLMDSLDILAWIAAIGYTLGIINMILIYIKPGL